MTDLPEVREANNSGSTIAQYPDGTWYWFDETWNYGDDTHYPTYEEAARAQNLYCIESLGMFDELLKDNPFLDPTCPKCGGLAIESPSVVRMTGDQAAAYVKLLHTADPSSMKIKDLSREQLEEAFALLSDLVHGGEFAAAMNNSRYCPNLPMAAWREFGAAEEFVRVALGVTRS